MARFLYRSTALYIASENGHSEVVKKLIVAGATVDVQDDYGWTALYIASENGHSEVVKELIAAGAKVDVQNN
ncbi:putative ankyrin repeat protein R863, partial [Diplonema papillatum]